ncbi:MULTISPECIES: hypothetical protein [Natrinema]|uniref:Uncharacterized protein n=1 Tax=Natrinema gari JCM 14663 TaxID=1230459 RepID=L9YWS1_9EURY|nr:MULTISPECIES: hypothetical protein [Natrinema]AFO55491.1 hypothetical protein NJ7G_0236 [Natrinema sp. J7-2]ELY78665.1 hypothetical protein C486_12822 [Natrinema gari JCM 14663]
MRERLESDLGFYYAVGGFIIAVFVVGLATFARLNPDGVGTVELVGLAGGFFLFMLVYFIAISVQRLEDGDSV